MWAILSSSPSELAGMIGFEKAEEGGGTVPSCGEGLISDCRWSPRWSQSYSEAFPPAGRFLHSETGRW